ncbi:hypothetical protein ES703_60299 [subsurface metagenome]
MTDCFWCGRSRATGSLSGLNFCKRCYPFIKARRLPLNQSFFNDLNNIFTKNENAYRRREKRERAQKRNRS